MVMNGTTGTGVSVALTLVGVGLTRVAVGRMRVGVGRRAAELELATLVSRRETRMSRFEVVVFSLRSSSHIC